ncbi:hypothetical protein RB597_001216 [Gaeumannomyces tritici]
MCPRSCRRRQQMASRPFGPRCHRKRWHDAILDAEPSQQQQQQQAFSPVYTGLVSRLVTAATAATPAVSPASRTVSEQHHSLGPPPAYTPSSGGILTPPTPYGKDDRGPGSSFGGSNYHQYADSDDKKWLAAQEERQGEDGIPPKRKSALSHFAHLFSSSTGDRKGDTGKNATV